MSDLGWIHGAITAARPQAVGALLRYFRDMDRAEEAFQDACLRALKSWPDNVMLSRQVEPTQRKPVCRATLALGRASGLKVSVHAATGADACTK